MLTLKPGNPLRSIPALAQSIALPHEHPPARYPSFPALERTAIMSFNQPNNYNAPITTTFVTTKGILNRSAVYPLWLDQFYGTNPVIYQTTFPVDDMKSFPLTTTSPLELGVGNNMLSNSVGNFAGDANTPIIANSTGTPNFLSAIVGVDPGCGSQPFTYCPGWCCFAVSAGAAFTANTGLNFIIEVWSSPGVCNTYSLTDLVGSTGAISASSWGSSMNAQSLANSWVRIKTLVLSGVQTLPTKIRVHLITGAALTSTPLTTSTTTRGTFTAVTGTVNCLLPYTAPTEFYNSSLPWRSTRVTSVGFCLTNTSAVLNKQGSVLAGRITPTAANIFNVTYAQIQAVHPSEKALLPLEEGMYTYCPPTTDMGYFYDYTTDGVFTTPIPQFRLDNDAMANVFFLSDPNTVPPSFAINIDWHLEFRTTSSLFDLGVSTITLEQYHQALIVLMTHGYFFNNLDHIKLIKALLRGGKALNEAFSPAPLRFALREGLNFAGKYISNRPGPTPRMAQLTAPPVSRARASKPRPKRVRQPKSQQRVRSAPPPPANKPKMRSGLDMYLESKARR